MSVPALLRRLLEKNPAPRGRGEKREENPVSPRTLGIGIAALAAAGLGAYGIAQATKKKPAPKKKKEEPKERPRPGPQCDPSPFAVDGTVIVERIEVLVDAGERNVDEIAEKVASELFAKHPTSGVTLVWPPGPNASDSQQCVWAFILYWIDVVFKKRGIKPEEPSELTPISFVTHTSVDPGYPWEEPTIHMGGDGKHYPTPGTFYYTEDGEQKRTNEIINAWLGSAMIMAARKAGYTPDQEMELRSYVSPAGVPAALKPNAATPTGKRIRKEARQILNTVNFNRVYLQNDPSITDPTNPNDAAQHQMLPQGLGLDPREVHQDNRARMADGLPSKRATSISGSPLPPPARGHNGAFYWLPALDLTHLLAKTIDGKIDPQLRCMKWSDGTSTKEPPPVVQKLGLDLSGVLVPETPSGCPPAEPVGFGGPGGEQPGVQQAWFDVGGG